MGARPRIADVVKELLQEESADSHAILVELVIAAVTVAIGRELQCTQGDRRLGAAAKFRLARLCARVWDDICAQTLGHEPPAPGAAGEAN